MRPLFSALQRTAPRAWAHSTPISSSLRNPRTATTLDSVCARCRLSWKQTQVRFINNHQTEEDARWVSPIDQPAQIVRAGRRRHGPGLIILALIPIISFALGTWQIQRLDWKTKLIAKYEDRIVREPLPLPPRVDPSVVHEFDYRRIYATGRLRHDQEMLIGPRMREGQDGFIVITPLERGEGQSTVLVNRGWISKKMANQKSRPEGLPRGEVTVEGLIREPWKKNMFTPDNKPEDGRFYFPDVEQMAALTGSQPVWIEQTQVQDYIDALDREAKGIPIGRAAEVNLRNNHSQYIFTWFGLSLATSIMMWMVMRKPPGSEAARRLRQNKNW
ncbi:cytochrome oxidase assembly protein SHY1 [Aspergillus stella-maris]|uniref:cytochrome oxidase assembly protein SHY1 n=1 Tax=Aspergillus stella-maris TaxID=1810926 RepID=UPI003CCD20AE